ncbi:predicted protein [Naegleria gruberi]|uniref:Predicted protein n=1 Tax=Naegleria gruberi TaxID=5762 RepID=D2VYL3_NAEGR|nr:uncharacterized protein NAEGRDRAFT_74161 [Naegleria gruberi]EFC38077.1 predicted protein [Naegleria gruberi]|eukprot:XP_002670821.1 predicted protein [Naegleria gruberi strain NEG-M]
MIKKRTAKNVSLRAKEDASTIQPAATAASSLNSVESSDQNNQQEEQTNENTTSASITTGEPEQITSSERLEEDGDNINETLEKTILKQKLRSRPKGMQANLKTGDLFDLDKIKNSSVQRKKEKLNILQGGTQGGLVDRNSGDWIAMKLANMEKAKIMGSTSQLAMDMAFTEAELSEQDKRLFEFIKERMKEQGYSYDQIVNNDDEDEGIEKAKKKISVDINELLEKEKNLYKLPDELKVEKIDISSLTRRKDNANKEAKPLTEEERQKLLSGAILEVPLSTAAKVENIRETNEKVKELEDNNKRKYHQTASDEYVFTQYKKKYAHKR